MIVGETFGCSIDSPLFSEVGSFAEYKGSVPILIVGYKNAQTYIQGFNILQPTYKDKKIWWCFSMSEDRNNYETTLKAFQSYCIQQYAKEYIYTYIDLLSFDFEQKKRMVRFFINEATNKTIYTNGKMLFYIHNKHIYGVSLALLNYCGISTKKILNKLKAANFIRFKCNDKEPLPIPLELILN